MLKVYFTAEDLIGAVALCSFCFVGNWHIRPPTVFARPLLLGGFCFDPFAVTKTVCGSVNQTQSLLERQLVTFI